MLDKIRCAKQGAVFTILLFHRLEGLERERMTSAVRHRDAMVEASQS
jgi:hypothetical protein